MPWAADILGELDENSRKPPEMQIADQITAAITAGDLAPGAALPSRRFLAGYYRVSLLVASRAIEVLRNRQLVLTTDGRGYTTCVQGPRPGTCGGCGQDAAGESERFGRQRWHTACLDQAIHTRGAKGRGH